MKQNGFRLVQRKFAQGVPLPPSAAPPPAQERKTEAPYPTPRSVYHNNMSAKNLLDIVAMQNIHKHKEPMVLLERLREDAIPAPAPPPKVPTRKRRNMCLRSGKAKLPDAVKVPCKRRKKLSSESTDDIPLVYYFKDPNRTKPPQPNPTKNVPGKEKRQATPKRGEKNVALRKDNSEPLKTKQKSKDGSDGSFTFKQPTSAVRLSYRIFKRKGVTRSVAGRPLKKGPAKSVPRRANLRSARLPSDASVVARRLRSKKPPVNKDEPSPSQPGPSAAKLTPGRKRTVDSNIDAASTSSSTDFKLRYSPDDTRIMPSPRSSTDFALRLIAEETFMASARSSTEFSLLSEVKYEPTTSPSPQPGPSGVYHSLEKRKCMDRNMHTASTRSFKDFAMPSTSKDMHTASTRSFKDFAMPSTSKGPTAPPAAGRSEITVRPPSRSRSEDQSCSEVCSNPEDRDPCTSGPVSPAPTDKQIAVKAVRTEGKKDGQKQFFKKAPLDTPTRLLRHSRDAPTARPTGPPPAPANPDVYDFDAELETSRPPSGLRSRRAPPPHKPTLATLHTIIETMVAAQTESTEPTQTKQSEPTQPATEPTLPTPEPTQSTPELTLPTPEPTQSTPETTQPAPDSPQPAPDSTQPSSSTSSPTSPEVFLEIMPESSDYCIQVKPKKVEEGQERYVHATLVKKDVISTKKKKTLIKSLSSCPSLLDKLMNCLSAEVHTELDNLMAAEQAEPTASTSAEGEVVVKLEGQGATDPPTYLDGKSGSVLDAPTFHPTAEEFEDPIKYYDKIAPQASKYGLCKIVPPAGFAPPCNMNDAIRFAVIYQYISKMYNRWGPVSRELAAIKAYLRTQSVIFARSPLLDGSEVNLPKLYHAVERNGGLTKVIQRKRWGRVAEEMKLTKLQHPERKLDPIYMRYLLPYATLSDQERQNIMSDVETCWTTKYQKMLERARNPFQRQNRMLGAESESDDDNEDSNTTGALHEAEDCIVQGRTMNLATFKKIATSLMDAHFEPNKQPPSAVEVEKAYWRAVLLGTEHIVANTASIDTGEEGYGFPKDPEAEYGTHPWNLKVLARNPNNVLRYLGPVLGVTVPTLHLSMLFSTSCWHRDPHGLPWTEYMHSGTEKIWYGIPRDESSNFRRAVETLCPAYCQNKSIWLASEITMVPPNILSEHGVKLSRLIQRPGEYVLVFPEAHSCSITTGLSISESVYFASNLWLSSVYKLFQELRSSCEPTMFSLEQLLVNGSKDESAPQRVFSVLGTLLSSELEHRRALEAKGLKVQERPARSAAPLNTSYFRAWNARDQDECEYCRSTLFLSKVSGLTGRKSAVCPEHALRLLETKKYKNIDLKSLEFVSSFSTGELEDMLERLESRAGDDAPADDNPTDEVIDLTRSESSQ